MTQSATAPGHRHDEEGGRALPLDAFAESYMQVRMLTPGAMTYTEDLGQNDPGYGFATVGGSELVAVRGGPAASAPCGMDNDIQVLTWDPVDGFTTPRDLGPAGGQDETVSAAVTSGGLVGVAWEAAPPDAACFALTGDAVHALTVMLPNGAPTPATMLSVLGPAPKCDNQGCPRPRWNVNTVAFGADPIVTWRPTRGNKLAAGAAIYR